MKEKITNKLARKNIEQMYEENLNYYQYILQKNVITKKIYYSVFPFQNEGKILNIGKICYLVDLLKNKLENSNEINYFNKSNSEINSIEKSKLNINFGSKIGKANLDFAVKKPEIKFLKFKYNYINLF